MAKRKGLTTSRPSHTGVESPSSIADTIHVSPSTPPTLMAPMSKPSRRSTRITPTDDMTSQNSTSPKLGVCTLTDASSERDILPSSNESSLPASSQTPSRKRPCADPNATESPKRPRRASDEEGTNNVKVNWPTRVGQSGVLVNLVIQDEETEGQPSCIPKWPDLNEQDLHRLNGHTSASSDRKLNDAVIHACLEGLACLQPYIFTIAPWEVQSIISTSHETQSFPNHHRAFLGVTEGLFCLNIARDHWVCVHLELQTCQATIYNSLGNDDTQRDEATRVIKILIRHSIDRGEAFAQWKFVAGDCPTQANAYDCGVYALATAYHLAYRLAIPDEFDAQLWRCFLYAFLMGRSPEPSVGISTIERVMDWHILRTDITELSDDPHVLYSQIRRLAETEINIYEERRTNIENVAASFERMFEGFWAKHEQGEKSNADAAVKHWERLLVMADQDITCLKQAIKSLESITAAHKDSLTFPIINSLKAAKKDKQRIKRLLAVGTQAIPNWQNLKANTLRQRSDQYYQLQQKVREALA